MRTLYNDSSARSSTTRLGTTRSWHPHREHRWWQRRCRRADLRIPEAHLGLATRAHIVAYKGWATGLLRGDTADAIDQAVTDGVDVIDYSIGSDTPGLIGRRRDRLPVRGRAGCLVATPPGTPVPTQGPSAARPRRLGDRGRRQPPRPRLSGNRGLGDGTEFFGASVTPGLGTAQLVDAANLRNESCDPDVKFRPKPKGDIVLARVSTGRAAKSMPCPRQGGWG